MPSRKSCPFTGSRTATHSSSTPGISPTLSLRAITLPIVPSPAMPTLIGSISGHLQRFLFARWPEVTIELGEIVVVQRDAQRLHVVAHMRFARRFRNGEHTGLPDDPGERDLRRCCAIALC